jgi:Brp/Blh family beta-carotene 15,15'-monooxygenase
MNKVLTIQSNFFILISLITIGLTLGLSPNLNLEVPMFFFALALIVLFGVPHGSLDVLFAKKTYDLNAMKHWLKFLSLYTVCALSIILIWLALPNVFFIAFLILSALHFSDDLNIARFNWLKLSYGIAIITVPSLLHGKELIDLYGMIIEASVATNLVIACQFLSYPIIGLLAFQLLSKKLNTRTKLEIISAIALVLILHPIYAFTLYFCFMHSARHFIRSRYFLRGFSRAAFFRSLILPTLAVILMGLVTWFFIPTKSLNTDLIRIIFVGLAALTVPHAWVLKKSNFSNWIQFR